MSICNSRRAHQPAARGPGGCCHRATLRSSSRSVGRARDNAPMRRSSKVKIWRAELRTRESRKVNVFLVRAPLATCGFLSLSIFLSRRLYLAERGARARCPRLLFIDFIQPRVGVYARTTSAGDAILAALKFYGLADVGVACWEPEVAALNYQASLF